MILRQENVGGREGVTTDEERVARGAEQRSGCTEKSRLRSGKSFIGKRKKFIFNAFIDFKPMKRFENRVDSRTKTVGALWYRPFGIGAWLSYRTALYLHMGSRSQLIIISQTLRADVIT